MSTKLRHFSILNTNLQQFSAVPVHPLHRGRRCTCSVNSTMTPQLNIEDPLPQIVLIILQQRSTHHQSWIARHNVGILQVGILPLALGAEGEQASNGAIIVTFIIATRLQDINGPPYVANRRSSAIVADILPRTMRCLVTINVIPDLQSPRVE